MYELGWIFVVVRNKETVLIQCFTDFDLIQMRFIRIQIELNPN